jgi:hypothetical protein
MAREAPIGIFEPQVQADSAMPRRTIPSMSPGSIGEGLASLGNALDKKLSSDAAASAASQLATTRVAVAKLSQDNQQKYPTGDGYTASMLEGTQKISNDLIAGAKGNPYLLARLKPALDNINSDVEIHSMGWEATTHAKWQTDSIRDSAQTDAAVVKMAPWTYESTLAEKAHANLNRNADPSVKIDTDKFLRSTYATAAVEGWIKQDPQAAIDSLQNPDKALAPFKELTPQQSEAAMAGARRQLAENQGNAIAGAYQQGGWAAGNAAYGTIPKMPYDPELKEMIQTQANQGITAWQQQQRQKLDQPLLALETRLAVGNVKPDDGSRILQMHQAGVYTAEQAASKLGKVNDLLTQQDDANAGGVAFQAMYDAHKRFDPEHSKKVDAAADLWFKAAISAANLQPGSQEWQNIAAEAFDRTNVLPPSVTSWARTALTGDDPKEGGAAAMTLARMGDIAAQRGIPYEIDAKTKAQTALIVKAVSAEVPPEKAFGLYKNIDEQPESVRKLNDAEFRKNRVQENNQQPLVEAFNAKFGGGLFSSAPEIPDEVKADYNTLLHDYYIQTKGDAKAAAKLASDDILQSGWGVTSVNGDKQWMKWAPEALGHDPAAIRADMEKAAGDLTPDPSSIRLVPYRDTETTHGQKWNLQYVDKDGQPQVALGKNGMPLPYYLPSGQAEYEAAQAKKKAESAAALEANLKRNKVIQDALLHAGDGRL